MDGNNVMGSRPDGWWRDREGARRRLVARLVDLHRPDGEPVAVVFDGRARPDRSATGVTVSFAPGGPDAADRVIADRVRALEDPAATTVVTSDARLAREVRAAGAPVMGAGAFLALLDGLAG